MNGQLTKTLTARNTKKIGVLIVQENKFMLLFTIDSLYLKQKINFFLNTNICSFVVDIDWLFDVLSKFLNVSGYKLPLQSFLNISPQTPPTIDPSSA